MTATGAPSPANWPWLQKYPAHVPRTIEIPDRSLPELLAASSERWPDRTALAFYGARWSYRQLWAASGIFAGNLSRSGLRPGDRFAVNLPNCPAYPIAFFGALRAGLSVVQVSPLYVGQDLHRVLDNSRPRAIAMLDIHYPQFAAVRSTLSAPPTPYVARLRSFYPPWTRPFVNFVLRRHGLPTAVPEPPAAQPWTSLLVPASPPTLRVTADQVAVLQYTGGTTGRPKAALLTHRNLVANALQCRAWFSIEPPGSGVVLASIPFFHVYGMTVGLVYPIAVGATVVLQLRPDVPEILRLIRRYHPTQFPAVPALYNALAQHPKVPRKAIRSIHVCVSGSAPLPLEVAKRFEALTGGYLVEGYGLTEASPVTHANPIQGERRDGSIGLPFPNTEERVVDLETGERILPTGEAGELCVRGPQVMLGYYGEPDETRAVLRDGWLYTGDIARLDSDGYAYIVDRKKDLVNVGGLKVYPREVDEVLFQHPSVADAACVGVPDVELGEVVHAFVVPKSGAHPTEAELIAFVQERIAHYKAPRRIHFRSELPRSGVQKVLRRALREEAVAAPPRAA